MGGTHVLLSDICFQAQKSARERFALHGVDVSFRGAIVRVTIAPAPPSLDLTTGGFATKQVWRIRLPSSITPAPQEMEHITTASGRYYVITSVLPPTGAAHMQEYLVEAEWS
jgi:hypothetical protein